MRAHINKGIGLLETLLVLVIISAILILTIRYFGVMKSDYRVSKGAYMINKIVDATTKWIEGEESLTGPTKSMDLQTIIDAGLLPQQYHSSPWSTPTYPKDIDLAPIANKGFRVVINNVPAKDCCSLLATMSKANPNIRQDCSGQTDCKLMPNPSLYILTYYVTS